MPGHAKLDLLVRSLAPRRLMTRGCAKSESEPQLDAEYY